MAVDVVTEIVIDRPVAEVAAFAANPANATAWYEKIDSIEWRTDPVVAVGSKAAFVAKFLGKRLEYTYEIVEYEPESRLVMRTAEGPFPMATTYEWAPEPGSEPGSRTRMTLRNAGEPAGFSKLVAPVMAMAMRRANNKDLQALKALMEG